MIPTPPPGGGAQTHQKKGGTPTQGGAPLHISIAIPTPPMVEGPKAHQKKAGTPTMGGVLIIISIVIPTLLWADLRSPYVWVAILSLLGYGWIGFLDDYAKVTRRRNLGLTGRRKLVYQFIMGFSFAAALLVMRAYGEFSN